MLPENRAITKRKLFHISPLWRWIIIIIFMLFGGVFFAALHKIDVIASQQLRALLSEHGIASEFTLHASGISSWQMKEAHFTYGDYQLEVKDANARLSLTKLLSAPVNAMFRNVTLRSMAEGKALGTIEIPEIALQTSPADDGTVTLDAVIGEIVHKDIARPYFAPLKLTASISDVLMSGEVMKIYAKTGDTLDKWSMQSTIDYRQEDGSWLASANLDPVLFESGLLQPDSLFPILRGKISGADGALTFGARFEQKAGAEKPEGLATLTMNNLSATVDDVDVKGVSGSVAFNSYSPLLTNGEQTISIQEILIGLPLSEGKLPFSLIKDNQLRIGATSWQWAGGILRTEPIEMNLADMDMKGIKLDADKLLLQSLLSGLLKEGITASGTLEGSLPVRFEAGKPVITGGLLQTDGAGVISYKPTPESGVQKGTSFQTDLLLQAIENFHYEFLRLKIDSIEDDKLLVQLSTRGNNPDLYDGKPIELNVNLTGNLFDIARSGTETYAIPKRIQEQFAP